MTRSLPVRALIFCGLMLAIGGVRASEQPSFDCGEVASQSIESMICTDAELAALDRQLSNVYVAAQAKATLERPPRLQAEQRGWIKGRNECWKAEDSSQCVHDGYRRRIAELQARYRLVDTSGVVTFMCNNDPNNQLVASYFATEPQTLIADYGDSISLMYRQPETASMHYRGSNESIAINGEEAVVVWGYKAAPMRCKIVQ